MASLPRLSLIAVIPRDSGAGRVRIGRDGEAIATYALAADDARRLAAGIDGAGQVMAAAGAREIFTANARMQRWADGFPPGAFRFGPGRGSLYSFHLMGSARMGGSPAQSAASPSGETWDVRNLVVADGSAFPTASGVNPMVTIEAIAHLNATRLAERLASTGGRRGRPRPSRRSRARCPAEQHLELPRRRLRLADDDLRAGRESLVVEPVQELAVVLGEPDDLRLAADFEVGERRQLLVLASCSNAGSTGQPCGQRSGLPSRTSIRSTMSSLNVSPSSSAWMCASPAV